MVNLSRISLPPRVTSSAKQAPATFKRVISRNPFVSFFGLLVVLLVLVIVGNFLRKPAPEAATPAKPAQLVDVYQSGQSPTVVLTGHIEESGVITIMAQTSGIVQKVNVTEGKHIKRSNSLVNLSSTYSGANTASVSRQLAQVNDQATNDNFGLQEDIISKQRDLANKADTQASEMRSINRQSLDDTNHLIDLNQQLVDSLNGQANALPASQSGTLLPSILQAQSSLNQLKSGERSLDYSSSDTNTPAQIGDESRDLTLRQLDLQERSLNLAKQVADLNLKLARIGESLYFPTTPCDGVVERVFVKVGQSVSPGTPIAEIQADTRQMSLVVPLSVDLANQVTVAEPSYLVTADHKTSLTPRFVSTQPTEGALAAVFYTIPAEVSKSFEGQTNVSVEIPLGVGSINVDSVFIPLDAVYQTQDKSFVYVVSLKDNQKIATTKEVILGDASGRYVKVTNGLTTNDQVITTRGITDGDVIRTE